MKTIALYVLVFGLFFGLIKGAVYLAPQQDEEAYIKKLEGSWQELAGLDRNVQTNPPRVRITELAETSIVLPTRRYISKLKTHCHTAINKPYRYQCLWQLREIAKGIVAAHSVLNPIYGRAELTDGQLKYVQYHANWAMEHLKGIERRYLS